MKVRKYKMLEISWIKIRRYVIIPLIIFIIFTICVHQCCYAEKFKAKVIRVIDGDTIVIETLKNKIVYRVRLIGVDTPETKHPFKGIEYYGIEATNFVKKLISDKIIFIKTSFKFDFYNRLLSYVYIGKIFLNLEIIKQGFGYAYLKYRFDRNLMDLFAKAELNAIKKKRGLWK